jgi:N-acetylneuraminic acid mutarotase
MKQKWIQPVLSKFSLLGTLALILLFGCNEGTSTETIAGKTTGMVYLADGKPAVGARVRVFPVGYRPLEDSASTLAFKTSTDDKGHYFIDSLSAGEYNILSDLKGQGAAQDSIFLSSTPRTLAADTLSAPGILCGYVALQPGDPPGASTVQILGTQAYTNVDDDGFFELPELPPGLYRAAVTAGLDGYSILYRAMTVRSGKRDTLADTLRPKYSGIPQVSGLQAVFDTLHQTVRLSWSKSNYPNLGEYLLYRDAAGAVVKSQTPIVALTDTFYVDHPSVNAYQSPYGPIYDTASSSTGTVWEYRVGLRDKFGYPGRTYGSLEVSAPPAQLVTTAVSVAIKNVAALSGYPYTFQGRASIGDTAYLIASYRNPTRGLKLLRWFRDGNTTPIRTVHPQAKEGADTLIFICPSAPASVNLRVEIADDGGDERAASASLQVLLDPPVVSMVLQKGSGPTETPFHLQANVSDGLGKLVKLEWGIGGLWIPTTGNDTTITLPAAPSTGFVCRYRATDDDGNVSVDSAVIPVTAWHTVTDLPAPLVGHRAEYLGGKIYLMGGWDGDRGVVSDRAWVFDPAQNAWSPIASMNRNRRDFASSVMAGRIYVTGGLAANGKQVQDAEVFDPATGAWTLLPAMPGPRMAHVSAAIGGKLYVIGGITEIIGSKDRNHTVDVFDPAGAVWSTFDTPIPFEGFMQAASVGADVYVFSTYDQSAGYFARFSPETNTWSSLDSIPLRRMADRSIYMSYSIAQHGGKIILTGGYHLDTRWTNPLYEIDSELLSYDTGTRQWKDEPLFSGNGTGRSGAALVVGGNYMYQLGGSASSQDQQATARLYWAPAP